jgi:hypothetical protein
MRRENPQPYGNPFSPHHCHLAMRNGVLTGGNPDGEFWATVRLVDDKAVAIVGTNTPFFIPEHAIVPVPRVDRLELWIEATLPRKGPARPIRLAVKKGGVLTLGRSTKREPLRI